MSTVVDDYSPIFVGDTGAPFAPVFQKKNGDPYPLVGATVTMKMQYENDPTLVKTCSNPLVIDDAANGRTHYNYQTSDVDTAGLWQLFITITINGKPVHADQKLLEILAAP